MGMLTTFLTALFAFSRISHALTEYPSVTLPVESLFDNQAASDDGSANFDAKGASFNSQALPPGPWLYDGISYDLPTAWGRENDNVIANGQTLSLEKPTFVHELHFVYAGDATGGEFVKDFVLNFTDNSTQVIELYAKNWYRWPILNNGAIQTPYHFEQNGTQKNFNATQIYQWSTSVSSERALNSITFPLNNPSHRLHIFAMSISPSTVPPTPSGPELSVRRARFTSRWEMINGERAQAVEVRLANLLPSFFIARNTSLAAPHEIEIVGGGIKTVSPGKIYRLVPADQARVDVFVRGSQDNGNAEVHIKDSKGTVIGTSKGWTTTALIENWTPEASVLGMHETPTWWNGAKYGIFIHWGVYSYPAWAPPNTYAEWYSWTLRNPPNSSNPTWNHHLDTYGKDIVYDDFIANFTASKFNASEWVDVFDRAGAKYFVFVTKHHDGYALFDTKNTTHRSSVYLGPKRDFLAELMSAAKTEKPDLHRGTYYSLPEWFNPDSAQYGFGQWPGGLAHNAFNSSEIELYTGHLNITDYLDDLQLPQMLDLALEYDSDIMWCDIGGPNKTLEFAAQFYNHAQATGRQVTMNNRCGAVPDFDTPEYATFGAIQPLSWESSEGMDPHSYGLNSATNASQYKNGSSIVQTLVDIVSKNGNFLLDIGPNSDGEIISPMMDGLLDAGEWLSYSGDCIYNTSYWFPGSQDVGAPPGSAPARFMTTAQTFCIVSLIAPTDGQLAIHKRLPLLPGDEIVFLNPNGIDQALKWTTNNTTGQLVIDVPADQLSGVRYAWAFQVLYKSL